DCRTRRFSEREPAVWLRVKCKRPRRLAPVADLVVRRRTHHERKHTRYKCPIKRTPLRVDRSWLRRLRYSYGRARGVPVCLVAESCRWMCRCDFGSLHFTVQKGGRLSTSPNQPGAANPAIAS